MDVYIGGERQRPFRRRKRQGIGWAALVGVDLHPHSLGPTPAVIALPVYETSFNIHKEGRVLILTLKGWELQLFPWRPFVYRTRAGREVDTDR